jgi:hypothetical protein
LRGKIHAVVGIAGLASKHRRYAELKRLNFMSVMEQCERGSGIVGVLQQ